MALKGAHWLVDHRPDLLEGCTEAIGEVGGFSTEIGGQRLYLIESGEKGIAWMRLRARGTAGHGSMANHDNAITHLAHALITLGDHEWPSAPGPSMQQLLDKVRELTGTDGTPDELLEHFGSRGAHDRRGHPQHHQPDDGRRRLQAQRGAG